MPTIKLPVISGGTNILSGNYFSGQGIRPYAEVRLTTPLTNSGVVYVALSGGITAGLSGVFPLSGFTGAMDGWPMNPGARYDLPKRAFQTSGSPSIFVQPDANCSGQASICWECF